MCCHECSCLRHAASVWLIITRTPSQSLCGCFSHINDKSVCAGTRAGHNGSSRNHCPGGHSGCARGRRRSRTHCWGATVRRRSRSLHARRQCPPRNRRPPLWGPQDHYKVWHSWGDFTCASRVQYSCSLHLFCHYHNKRCDVSKSPGSPREILPQSLIIFKSSYWSLRHQHSQSGGTALSRTMRIHSGSRSAGVKRRRSRRPAVAAAAEGTPAQMRRAPAASMPPPATPKATAGRAARTAPISAGASFRHVTGYCTDASQYNSHKSGLLDAVHCGLPSQVLLALVMGPCWRSPCPVLSQFTSYIVIPHPPQNKYITFTMQGRSM